MSVRESIDPVATAREVIADPRKKFTMSVLQIMSICNALVATADEPPPVITTDLAEALRALFAAIEHSMPAPAITFLVPPSPLQAAFITAKTLFEEEFPQ